MNSEPTTGQVQPRRLLPAAPRVVFIGSGPGESGLMTMRGAEILATAETVVYDAGVHSEIVTAYVPQAATLIDAADLGVAASTRGRRMAELARPDKTVVRLSSDDGIIFTNTTDNNTLTSKLLCLISDIRWRSSQTVIHRLIDLRITSRRPKSIDQGFAKAYNGWDS